MEALQAELLESGADWRIKGTLLLAPEGINGTIAGPRGGIDQALARLRAIPGFEALEHKESFTDAEPFPRLRVRIKKEIVTIREPLADPTKAVGAYVKPDDWNELIDQPDVITIDTRNDYEIEIGTFNGAVAPGTNSFGQFPEWVRENLVPKLASGEQPKIAMFCTGGIRCEKATALLKQLGFQNVFHLQGGILKYLEEVPETQSRWQGECFVFDRRVSVVHGLKTGTHSMCDWCNHAYDKTLTKCPHCNGRPG